MKRLFALVVFSISAPTIHAIQSYTQVQEQAPQPAYIYHEEEAEPIKKVNLPKQRELPQMPDY